VGWNAWREVVVGVMTDTCTSIPHRAPLLPQPLSLTGSPQRTTPTGVGRLPAGASALPRTSRGLASQC
jgi:hypothetical protein